MSKQIIITVSVVILVVAGIYFWQTQSADQDGVSGLPLESVSDGDNESVTDTSDWSDFRSLNFNIAFKHPSSWGISTTLRDNTVVLTKDINLDVASEENARLMIINGNWEHGIMGLSLSETKNTTINGVSSRTRQFRNDENGKIGLVIIDVYHLARSYGLEFKPSSTETEDDLDIFETLISTIEFIE